MKKLFLALPLLLLLILSPVRGSTPVLAASANFTPSSNVSLDLWNPTDIQGALTSALLSYSGAQETAWTNIINTAVSNIVDTAFQNYFDQQKDNQDDMLASIFALILCVLISMLAFWTKHDFLYLMASVTDLVYGLNFSANSIVSSAAWVEGIIVTVIGFFCLFHVATNAVKLGVKYIKSKKEN